MSRATLEQQLALEYALAERVSAQSADGYLKSVVIDSRPEPKRFGLVADPWQLDLLSHITPALESVAGLRKNYDGPRSIWLTLGRGNDKTSSIGRLINWLLAFSRRRLSMATGAGDTDQAALITEAMEAESRLNPWLSNRINHRKGKVTGPGGKLTILAANEATNFGRTDDVVIVDEITHWPKRGLFDVLWSGREKRPGSVFIVITNAGVKRSWQEEIKNKALADPKNWYVFEAPYGKQLASWMSPEAVQRMRDMLPRGLAKRVLDNKWIDPAEEADYLTRAEIQVCQELGIELALHYQTTGQKAQRYVAGIDYGPKRDRTALVVLHLDTKTGQIVVDRLDVWQGAPESPVRVQAVEAWIREVNQGFAFPTLVLDPYQMEGTIQKFEMGQEVVRFEARGGKRTYEMAESLRSLIVSKQLAWYPGAGTRLVDGREDTLVDEIAGLVLKPTPYGYRFDHEAGFHDDRAVALGMAALHACRQDPSGPGVAPDPLHREDITPEKFHMRLRNVKPEDIANKWSLWGIGSEKRRR